MLGLLAVSELQLLLGTDASYLSSALDLICTGVVDKLLTEFEKRVFLTKKAGGKWMDYYLKKVSCVLIY